MINLSMQNINYDTDIENLVLKRNLKYKHEEHNATNCINKRCNHRINLNLLSKRFIQSDLCHEISDRYR